MISVSIVNQLEDNYAYIISTGNRAVILDPAETAPIIRQIDKMQCVADAILCTHHHGDHVSANRELKKLLNCTVYGANHTDIPGCDHAIYDSEQLTFGNIVCTVIATPGHTADDVCFYFPANPAINPHGMLFTGDTLFGAGCGRAFEGSPDQMHRSLFKLMSLPDETRIYFGHEYTLDNLRFAIGVDPHNPALASRLGLTAALRREGKSSVPSTIGLEKATNPFFRVHDAQIRATLHMPHASDSAIFAELRHRKDRFV